MINNSDYQRVLQVASEALLRNKIDISKRSLTIIVKLCMYKIHAKTLRNLKEDDLYSVLIRLRTWTLSSKNARHFLLRPVEPLDE